MKRTFTERARDDYLWWLAQDRTTLKRINRLIEDAKRDPFDGIGKPEPLKHTLAGAWSRRITEEHRLVYLPMTTNSPSSRLATTTNDQRSSTDPGAIDRSSAAGADPSRKALLRCWSKTLPPA